MVNILLVDDNPSNLLSLEAILEAPDRNLIRASSGEEALRYLLDRDAAVILLDVHMPKIDGLETAAMIRGRERTRNVPIIFLTAHDSAGDSHITEGYSLGAVDYIIKPINLEALKSKVAVFVELFRKTEQVRQQAEMLREKNVELESANLRRLSRLVELGQELAAERDPEALLETFCHQARDIVGAHYAAVGILDEDPTALRGFYASGFESKGVNYDELARVNQYFLGAQFHNRRSLRAVLIHTSSKNGNRVSLLTDHPPVSTFLGALLTRQDQVYGWLYLAGKNNDEPFSQADERLAVTLTSQAMVAWENARLYAETQRHAAELEQEIAERKQLEKERLELLAREQTARQQAEEANRLKDEFLATVSHELRAPLNAMLGWATLIRHGKLDREAVERAIETIDRNAHTQKKLIDDLLDVSRIISGKLRLDVRPTEMVPVIEAAVESVRPAAAAKGVRFETRFDPAPPRLQADPTRLQQVIWNLVSNAVKFTPTGGTVDVHLKCFDSTVEIAVSDTGIGIAPEFLPHVFDRFRQADGSITRKHGGLGLGLAIVRYLTEMHGGQTQAHSAGEGLGATFTITLPIHAPTAMQSEKILLDQKTFPSNNEAVASPTLSGLRVLVVDDQPDARELMAMILRLSGAEVQMADGLVETMKTLNTWQPDILVSDIAMPDGDGYDLIRRVRQHEQSAIRTVPAIAVTGNASTKDRINAFSAGFQLHLPKPIEPEELVISVASLVRKDRSKD